MPATPCPGCQRPIADELLCPYCGAAQIPQKSKVELLREEHAAARQHGGFLIGMVVGLLLTATALAALYFDPLQLGWNVRGLGFRVIGMLLAVSLIVGAVLGVVVHRLMRGRKPRRPR